MKLKVQFSDKSPNLVGTPDKKIRGKKNRNFFRFFEIFFGLKNLLQNFFKIIFSQIFRKIIRNFWKWDFFWANFQHRGQTIFHVKINSEWFFVSDADCQIKQNVHEVHLFSRILWTLRNFFRIFWAFHRHSGFFWWQTGSSSVAFLNILQNWILDLWGLNSLSCRHRWHRKDSEIQNFLRGIPDVWA